MRLVETPHPLLTTPPPPSCASNAIETGGLGNLGSLPSCKNRHILQALCTHCIGARPWRQRLLRTTVTRQTELQMATALLRCTSIGGGSSCGALAAAAADATAAAAAAAAAAATADADDQSITQGRLHY